MMTATEIFTALESAYGEADEPLSERLIDDEIAALDRIEDALTQLGIDIEDASPVSLSGLSDGISGGIDMLIDLVRAKIDVAKQCKNDWGRLNTERMEDIESEAEMAAELSSPELTGRI